MGSHLWPAKPSTVLERPLPYARTFIAANDDEKVAVLNGILYNNLLHEKQSEFRFAHLNAAVEAFCRENGIGYEVSRSVYHNYGRGGLYNGSWKIKMNSSIGERQIFLTSIHEIVHCAAHYYPGHRKFRSVPRPVQEAECYIVEYRVGSFFLGPESVKEEFNNRIYWYGPKRNIHMIREEACVEFADYLIYWIIDYLDRKGWL